MAIAQEDLELIKQQLGTYVKEHLSNWLAEQSLGKPPVVYELELRERMVRVEEELRHQRELMQKCAKMGTAKMGTHHVFPGTQCASANNRASLG